MSEITCVQYSSLNHNVGKKLCWQQSSLPAKHRKLSKYCHWKRGSDSVVLATIEGEIEGKCFPGRRRTAWIDDMFGGGQAMT